MFKLPGTTVYLPCQRCHVYKRMTSLINDMYPVQARDYIGRRLVQAIYQRIFNPLTKICIYWQTVLFAEHCASRVILWRTLVKWWFIKLCAIFSWPHCINYGALRLQLCGQRQVCPIFFQNESIPITKRTNWYIGRWSRLDATKHTQRRYAD